MGSALPQPPLSKMPGRGAGGVARRPPSRIAAGSLFPCRLHLAAGCGRDLLSEQVDRLWPLDARRGAGAHRPCRKRLSARIGLIAVLHTWGQTLTHHPHVHCLVPGGGVALDDKRWVEAKPNFLLSVHALSKAFRHLFLDGLEAASGKGELSFFGELAPLAGPEAFNDRIRALRQSPFVVYAKPPFGGPARVLAYLARYTHRTAIANSRLVAVDDNEVAFFYKDYRRSGRSRIMRLAPHEFIRRFLLHVLPDGFHRIRHYGFLAMASAAKSSHRCDTGSKSNGTRSPTTKPRRRRVPNRRRTPLTNRSPSARIAAASCAAWGPSRRTNPAPFAATHHDHERRPDLDRLRIPTPPRHRAADAELQRVVRSPSAPFGPDCVVVAAPAAQATAAGCSNPSTIARRRLRNAPLGVQNQDRPRAFPIAANRPAASFNPAYVRSPFATPDPRARDLT